MISFGAMTRWSSAWRTGTRARMPRRLAHRPADWVFCSGVHHIRSIPCQWETPKSEATRQPQRQLVGLERVRFVGGTLQSFVRCSSDALSLRRSFPVLTGAAVAASSWSAARVAEHGVRLASRKASMIRCMGLDSIMPGAPLHHRTWPHTPILALGRVFGARVPDRERQTMSGPGRDSRY
jgi:hypothetical protein